MVLDLDIKGHYLYLCLCMFHVVCNYVFHDNLFSSLLRIDIFDQHRVMDGSLRLLLCAI